MKILLINPPNHNMLKTQVSREVEHETGFQPPLGIMYLASYVRRNSNHEIRVLDAVVEKVSYHELEEFIASYGPDILGITTTSFTMVDVLLTAEAAKEVDKSIWVCLGGAHVDIYPEETVALPYVDFAIRGEGEFSFLELVNALGDGGDLRRIRGLVFKEDGKVVMNEAGKPNSDLDSLPFPARDLTPWQKYYSIVSKNRPTTNLLTTKGCPYNCIFCYKHGGGRIRYRGIKNVLEEIEACVSLGIKEVFFEDETFNLNRNRALSFCDEIRKRGLKLPWGARTRVDLVDRVLLSRFKEAGCVRLHIGVEAGTEKILKVLRKNITPNQTKEVFKATNNLGIITVAYFMIGSPDETEDDIKKTIDFACEIDPDYVQFSVATPFPATDLYYLALARGIYTSDYWKEFAENPLPGFKPRVWEENLNRKILDDLLKYAHRKFYFRPKYIFRKICEVRSIREFKKKARAGIRLLAS
jgi:anaerobic magnesium-protoporphyrin IX monomethyl ester cyclase